MYYAYYYVIIINIIMCIIIIIIIIMSVIIIIIVHVHSADMDYLLQRASRRFAQFLLTVSWVA